MANEITSLINDSFFQNGAFEYQGDCEVGRRGNASSGALRFSNLQIAKDQSIISAELIYKYDGVGTATTGDWKFKVYGIDQDNTGNFSSNPLGRSKTTARITIDTTPPISGRKTLDVKSILEEITTRSGWSSGNNVGFLFLDDGSDEDVFADCDIEDSYLSYRLTSEPNFKPTPKSVSAPSLPSAESYGLKISRPGKDVFSADEDEIYFTSRKKQFKVLSEGYYKSTSSGNVSVSHNLGYTPFVTVYAKNIGVAGEWNRLPITQTFEDHATYYIGTSSLILHAAKADEEFYYYIFLDQLV